MNLSPKEDPMLQLDDDIESIEQQLQKEDLSLEAQNQLLHDLQETSQAVRFLQERASSISSFVGNYLREVSDKIVELHGVLKNRSIEHELSKVKEEVDSLENSIKRGSDKKVAKLAAILKTRINALCETHALSRQERRIIALARGSLKRASAHLSSTEVTLPPPKIFTALPEPVELDDITKFFDIADHFYHKDIKTALRLFNQLSLEEQKKVHVHLQELGVSSLDLQFNLFKTTQALIATAHEVADSDDGEPYLTQKQIDQMFSELDQIRAEEAR